MVVLPVEPTQGDLEAAYIARGASIVACDGARDLAAQTLAQEHALIDAWLAMQTPRKRFGIF